MNKDYYFNKKNNFLKNGDLEQLIKQHKQSSQIINPSRIFKWTIQAAQGLEELHSKKIIHRDVKPANIFLSKDDKIKLGDLGIAKSLDEYSVKLQSYSGEFSIVGGPLYMSPEIIKGQSYSFNTDVWSLGCIVFELLFLTPAFTALNIERNVEKLDFQESLMTTITKK